MSLPEGFIAHTGGPCPVHHDAMVELIFADGERDLTYAGFWSKPPNIPYADDQWAGECAPDDRIIAYRVASDDGPCTDCDGTLIDKTSPEPFVGRVAYHRGQGWLPIESAPVAEPFLAGVYVSNNKTGQRWWECHVVWIDDETGEIDSDTDAGWSIRDYSHWQPLPPAPNGGE